MLALTALSPGWVAFFYIVALVILLIAAFRDWRPAPAPADGRPARVLWRINLVALGIAVVVFVLAWQALASTK